MRKSHLSIIIGLVAAIISIAAITSVYPIADDLLVENPYWNGLSELYKISDPVKVRDYVEIDNLVNPGETSFFIIGPYSEFTIDEAEILQRYISSGGSVILADDFGTGNQLLEILGVEPRFMSSVLRDSVFKEKNRNLPLASSKLPGVDTIVLNYPTAITDANVDDVIAWSSPLSYLQESDDSTISASSYPVMVELSIGEGELVLMGDSSPWINSMLDKGDNKRLLSSLSRGVVLIDETHSTFSILRQLKIVLQTFGSLLDVYEFRYGLVVLVIIVGFRLNVALSEAPLDPVEELSKKYPEYNRDLLEKLEEERRKSHALRLD